MSKKKLQKLLDNVRASVQKGYGLDLAIRAEVFAHRLSQVDEKQLRDAASETVN